MAQVPFTDETLEQLGKAGVKPEGDPNAPKIETQTPEITLVDTPTTTEKPAKEVKPKIKIEPDPDKVKADADKTPPKVEPTEEDLKVVNTMKEAGLDVDAIKKRVIDAGDITPEIEAEMKEKLDPAVVDGYVKQFRDAKAEGEAQAKAAKEAEAKAKVTPTDDTDWTEFNKAQTIRNDYIYDSVGGKDKFDVMSSTLAAGLDKDSLALLNTKLNSDNMGLIQDGMKDAVAHYNKVTGRGGKLMSGDGAPAKEAALPFVTKDDYKAVVVSDKYKTDKEFAAKMDAARLASKKADNPVTMPGQYRAVREGQIYNV